MIEERNYDAVRDVLDDDESLNETVTQEYKNSLIALESMLSALKVFRGVQSYSPSNANISWSDLYIHAMSGSLLGSTMLGDILGLIKKLPSDAMINVLNLLCTMPDLPSDFQADLRAAATEIGSMTQSGDGNRILRSAHDIHHSTLRTTVVAQKVSLSKDSGKLSSQDKAYTKTVDHIYDILDTYFNTTLINPSELFLNEILSYNSKSTHRGVFMPEPRFAIERALSSPHHYLGCACCSSSEGVGLKASQPAIAIVYQLYLESGSLINAADLWEAFWTIVGGEEGTEEEMEKNREEALAQFSQALAELKYMGLVKNSRKKADHLQKLAWMGL